MHILKSCSRYFNYLSRINYLQMTVSQNKLPKAVLRAVNSYRLVPNTGHVYKYFTARNVPYDSGYILFAGLLTWLGLKRKEEDEDPLIETLKRAVLCITKEDFNTAEQILHVSLKIAQERMDTQGITYVYDMLANVAFSKKEWQKAENLFVETMKRLIAAGTNQNDNSIVEMSLKLAQIYSHTEEYQKAVDGFEFCLDTQKKKLPNVKIENDDEVINSKALLGMIHSTYALFLMDRKKYSDALKQYKSGLDIALDVYGEENYQTLVLMNDVGTVASLLHQHDEAISYISKAISIGTKINSPDLPAFYCNLASIKMQRGDLQAAEIMCQNAIEIAKTINDKNALEEAKRTMKVIRKHAKTKS